MAISKDKKAAILAKLSDALAEATAVAFVGFTKLTVADVYKLRRELKLAGVSYFVAKKTLLRLALSKRAFEGEVPDLRGEVAVAWTTEDVTAPARGVHEFGKKLKGAITLLGGVFDGELLDAQKITAIATIPPLPALRAMFANIINSPRQRFALALGEVAKLK